MPESVYHKSDEPSPATTPKPVAPRPVTPKLPHAPQQQNSADPAAIKPEPVAENVDELKTTLSWTPSLHDRRFQLQALGVLLLIGLIYVCFHFGLSLSSRFAVDDEQQRLQQLIVQCLNHDGNPQHAVFTAKVQQNSTAATATQPASELLALSGDSYTFPAWLEISKLTDPTVFVGKLGAADSIQRLVVVTVDSNPAGARADTGNVAIHASTYGADLPLDRKWEGEAQLNIYLKHGATFRAFEGARQSDGNGVAFSVEADSKRSTIHLTLQPDGKISIQDSAGEITHDTIVYELDRSGPL
jgi:hypothetical protein